MKQNRLTENIVARATALEKSNFEIKANKECKSMSEKVRELILAYLEEEDINRLGYIKKR